MIIGIPKEVKQGAYRVGLLLVVTALAMLAGLTGGCRTISKGVTESVLEQDGAQQWRVHYGSRVHYGLTNETMDKIEFEGSLKVGDTTVRYQPGLGQQAQCIADKTAELREHVQAKIGLTISTRSTVYLLRFDERPENFDITLAVEPNEFPLPLFVRAGEESCESILAQNRTYPYLFFHELVETSLAAGKTRACVLPDLAWGALGLNVHINNYTRWFREGLANYAGYLAYEAISRDISSDERLHHRQTLVHTEPFSSLARVGDDLLSWRQSSRGAGAERTFYSAALGLFLLIEDRFGEDAIRRIVNEIPDHKAVDGRDLIDITSRVINTDLRRLIDDFAFPEIGVELVRLTPALALNKGVALCEGLLVQSIQQGGPGQQAGLKEDDVITAVGPDGVANSLDFELALFKARAQDSVSLAVQRRDAGAMTVELPLHKPGPGDAADTPPGKRRNPLKKGTVESTVL